MKSLSHIAFLLGVILTSGLVAAEADVAIAIVYDTSGSMTGKVKDAKGNAAPKYTIAARALEGIVARLEKFAAGSGKKLHVGLYTFSGNTGVPSVPLGPFDPKKIRDWIAGFKKPNSGTPLGNATAVAAKDLLALKADSRHVLAITDGENTVGPPPEQPIARITDAGLKSGELVYFHFIAFDVNASVFSAIKKQGATLLSAADETQLNERLTFVLEEKILLEKE